MTQDVSAGDGRATKTQAAKQGAAQTGQKVSQAGGALAHSAADQGRDVAHEASEQARQLMGQATSQLREQAEAQQQRAADGLRALGDQLHTMSERTDQPGVATDLVRHAAGRVHQAAHWLDQREPGAVLNDIRDYARRNPGIFLAGAAVAGVLAGRLGRGMSGARDSGGRSGGAGSPDSGDGHHQGDGHRRNVRPGAMPEFRPTGSSAPGASYTDARRGSVDEEADPGGGPAADPRPGGTRP
ncbi:hypothetical protein ACIBF5_02325 [Micromonospora sp. NPDC050417]|uniref:hypothetical protein n=1 Tax=Micromonospora sp. NPDC050417 TaxID=3364280 RepID=UPI0037AD0B27